MSRIMSIVQLHSQPKHKIATVPFILKRRGWSCDRDGNIGNMKAEEFREILRRDLAYRDRLHGETCVMSHHIRHGQLKPSKLRLGSPTHGS